MQEFIVSVMVFRQAVRSGIKIILKILKNPKENCSFLLKRSVSCDKMIKVLSIRDVQWRACKITAHRDFFSPNVRGRSASGCRAGEGFYR